METLTVNRVKDYLLNLQDHICQTLELSDGRATFQEDTWIKDSGGNGRTRVLTAGQIFEQAAVNFSHVYGNQMPVAASAKKPYLAGCAFQALGISLVIHPQNPYVPTVHMNLRFFRAEKIDAEPIWWFGGGFDLTPYYGFVEDCQHWHQTAKTICAQFGKDVYPLFKANCDQYFYLPHRKEPRGIGGLFFDDLFEWGFEQTFTFIQNVGNNFLNAYIPIVQKRKHNTYSARERDFQLYRRGRYVEFNLLYDRGTLFGMQFGGRTESILVSLPPLVQWRYNWQPEENTPEAALYSDFLVPKEWV